MRAASILCCIQLVICSDCTLQRVLLIYSAPNVASAMVYRACIHTGRPRCRDASFCRTSTDAATGSLCARSLTVMYSMMLFQFRPVGVRITDMNVSVSLFVCLSVCLSPRISQKRHVETSLNFMYINCGRGSVLL